MAKEKPIKRLIVVIAAIVLLAVAALLIFTSCGGEDTSESGEERLVLIDGDTGKEYASYEAAEGMEFGISFIHSVNKSEVYEIYQIINGEIVLQKCIYSAFGAGVATEIEDGQALDYTDDGKMIISNINRVIPGLSYIVGTVSDHLLRIDGQEISLRELCGQNSTVRFLIEK